MKILMPFFLFCCTSCALFSQDYIFDQGSLHIGGAISFTNVVKDLTITNVSYVFGANIGYFFASNLEAGISLTAVKAPSATATTVEGTARYFFSTTQPVMAPYVGGGLGFTSAAETTEVSFSTTAGVAYIIAKNVTINTEVDVIFTKEHTYLNLMMGLGFYVW